jgi:GNAT superfamily N-acetyltransferase
MPMRSRRSAWLLARACRTPGGVLHETAEYPNAFVPLRAGDERIETPDYTLCLGIEPGSATVQRQSFSAGATDAVVAEVREHLRSRGRTGTQWEVGSIARPRDLVARLLDRGFTEDPDPLAVAMVLQAEPPRAEGAVVVRRAESLDDAVALQEVQFEAFEVPDEQRAGRAAWIADTFAQQAPWIRHVVLLDGEIVGGGTCAPTRCGVAMFGGAVRPSARGRGAYRALVRARWEEAVAMGTPALLTQAGHMSRLILERLGFAAIGRVHMLRDDF